MKAGSSANHPGPPIVVVTTAEASVPVRAAGPDDLTAIRGLLSDAGLPLDGAGEAFAHGVVATADDTVVGAAAIERYGRDGLLRSVVVAPVLRGTGMGRALVGAAEALARDLGIRDLYLLTETASDWFPRLGYAAMERAAAPDGIAGSWEFRFACVERGVLMHRTLPG
jgi:N-acetylglutamate synthase-like GNAT family acetyltransferase